MLPPLSSHLPVSFEVNEGQTDSGVRFLARAKHQMVYLTAEETVLVSGATGTNQREEAAFLAPLPTRSRDTAAA